MHRNSRCRNARGFGSQPLRPTATSRAAARDMSCCAICASALVRCPISPKFWRKWKATLSSTTSFTCQGGDGATVTRNHQL